MYTLPCMLHVTQNFCFFVFFVFFCFLFLFLFFVLLFANEDDKNTKLLSILSYQRHGITY